MDLRKYLMPLAVAFVTGIIIHLTLNAFFDQINLVVRMVLVVGLLVVVLTMYDRLKARTQDPD